MEHRRCYVKECTADVEYTCQRSSPAVYACKLHAKNYLDRNGKTHSMTSIFVEPYKGTRKAVLTFFAEKNKSQNDKFTTKKLRIKRAEDSNSINKAELEQESKMIHSVFKINPSVQNSPLMQTYQDSLKTHHQQISLYNLISKDKRTTTLLIYNTEIETFQEKILETPKKLDSRSCIIQLPSGKLFCYGNNSASGVALIIDENGGVQELPSGTPCRNSSAIYFKNSVYCFGGWNHNWLTLFSRFDLNRNEWVELAPLPKADFCCNSIIFKGNILISGWLNINLVRYSISKNSFTTIPYQFVDAKRKILINGERLYLIECSNGSVYESEIGSDTAWRRIAGSTISFHPYQTYCSYNKGGVYIGCIDSSAWNCFRFNLANKCLMKLP